MVDSGTLHLNLNQSTLIGDIYVADVATNPTAKANVNLMNGSLFKGASHGVDQVNIDGSSYWLLTGDSTVSTTINAGAIGFDVHSGFAILSANNYVGNDGELMINTKLGDDRSVSDKLIIDGGHASGSTALIVNNSGGTGAQTTNGIFLVEAINGGTTAVSAFKLGNAVRGGAFDYRLFRSGLSDGEEDNWYLRSTFDGGVIVDPEEKFKIYGPELSLYGAVMPTASRLGQTTLGTLHARVGEEENLRASGQSKRKIVNGAWGRIFTQEYQDQYTSIVDPSTSTVVKGFQIGADIYRHQTARGQRDHAGAYFAVVNAHADVNGTVTNADASAYVRQRTGNIDLDGVSAGVYWTHFGVSGWYTDAVLQATSYSGKAGSNRTVISTDGIGGIASLEAGYAFKFSRQWQLEPQVQLLYQHIKLDNTADQFSTIGLGASNSLLGRIGARLQHTGKYSGTLLQPYLRANVWSTMAGARNTVDYGGVNQISTQAGGHWGQLGVGVTAQPNKRTSLFVNVDGEFKLGNKADSTKEQRHTGMQISTGMRVNW